MENLSSQPERAPPAEPPALELRRLGRRILDLADLLPSGPSGLEMARNSARALLSRSAGQEIEITISEEDSRPHHADQDGGLERATLEKKLLIDDADIIKEYCRLAFSDELAETDLRAASIASKGVVGRALQLGHTDLVHEKLTSWAAYFSRSIDTVVLVSSAVKNGASLSDEAISLTLSMANEMLVALDRTIEARLGEPSAV